MRNFERDTTEKRCAFCDSKSTCAPECPFSYCDEAVTMDAAIRALRTKHSDEICAMRSELSVLRSGIITEGDWEAQTMRVSYGVAAGHITMGATLGHFLDAGGAIK